MKVVLNLNGKRYIYSSLISKRKMTASIRGLQAQNAIFGGTCTVKYTSEYSNSFDFSNVEELKDKLWPCLEPEMIEDFKNA